MDSGRVLVVCTGNLCRSPYVERVLAAQLRGTGVVVASAGTAAVVGQDMDPESKRRVVAAGGDDTGFCSRQLTADLVERADLVIAATREHLRSIVEVHKPALRYAFALIDLADLVAGVDQAEFAATGAANMAAAAAQVARGRRGHVPTRSARDAAIVDPIGRAPEVFDQMAAQALPAVTVLAAVLAMPLAGEFN